MANHVETDDEAAMAQFVAELKDKPNIVKVLMAEDLRPKPRTYPPHVAIPRSDAPFDFSTIIETHWSIFVEIFPAYNLEAPLVIRGTSGCWPVLKVLKDRPDFADLIRHVEFVGYHVSSSQNSADRKDLEIVRCCKKLSTVTIDIAIDDCCFRGPKEGGGFGWQSDSSREVKSLYDLNRLCLDPLRDHKKRFDNLNIRFVGSGLTWKRQFASELVHDLKYSMGKKGMKVTVLEEYTEKTGPNGVKFRVLKAAGLTDPYVGHMPKSKSDEETDTD